MINSTAFPGKIHCSIEMEASLTRLSPSCGFKQSFLNKPRKTQQTLHPVSMRKNLTNDTSKTLSVNNTRGGGEVLDEQAFERERLRLDAEARESMAEEAENQVDKSWKWKIRKRVWDLMEATNIAQFPRPVHHRIPNFIGASSAASKVSFSFPSLSMLVWESKSSIDVCAFCLLCVHETVEWLIYMLVLMLISACDYS